MPKNRHVSLLVKSLNGGGMQTSLLRLAEGIAQRGFRVDVVVAGSIGGELRSRVPQDVNLVSLSRSLFPFIQLNGALREFSHGRDTDRARMPLRPVPRPFWFLPSLVQYLKRERPDGLISAGTGYNLIALWAKRLSGTSTCVVVSERKSMAHAIELFSHQDAWSGENLLKLVAEAYPTAGAVTANSHGLAREVAQCTGLPSERIKAIYNPVVSDTLHQNALEPVDHPWLGPDMPPVVLGVGRLHPQKDFETLIKAFARVRSARPARLIILGNDRHTAVRNQLTTLARRLGVAADVDIAGFAPNPCGFMARAAVFVLSSRYEGCPNALIEALACGCPVVSTRCPHGPQELLENGKFGRLVDIGDAQAMGEAILATLDAPSDPDLLRGKAAEFGFDHAVDAYLECIYPSCG